MSPAVGVVMRSEILDHDLTGERYATVRYEVCIGDTVVWRRMVDIRKRNFPDRVAAAREQDHVAFTLARSCDGAWAAVKRLRGPGVIAGLIGRR